MNRSSQSRAVSARLTRRSFVAGALAAGACAALPLRALAADPASSSSGSDGEAGGVSAKASSSSADAAPAPAASPEEDARYGNWDDVLAAAKGQEVSWYGWGGDDARNTWIETVLAPRLKDRYGVTLRLVGMDINDILTQLSGEKQAGLTEGSVDFIWINGENFASAMANGYLWGPFTQYLPNFNAYVDASAPEVLYDFGSPTRGFEAPYGKTQMTMWVDGAQVSDVPADPDGFLAFCKAHAGMVTYPEPGDFTGTAFVSCLIAGVVGKDEFERLSSMADATADDVRAVVEPGLEYLRSLNPYLWKQGKTFPGDSTVCSQMYADGELVMNMGYGSPQVEVNDGALPATTRSFVFDTGTVGNSNFMAIAANAPHKAAALVAINEMTSPEMQLSAYERLRTMSVLDMGRLSDDERAAFDAVELGSAELPLDDLLRVRVSEAAGPVIPLLEQLWRDEVPGK